MAGTFNPPHLGHLILAQAALAQLGLEQVLFLPVGSPTHKATDQPARVRIDMLRISIEDNPQFKLDLTDVERDPPHYTATLIPIIQSRYPNHQLYFLIGSDSLNTFPDWHAPEKILTGCRLAVLPRPDHPIDWKMLDRRMPSLRSKVDQLQGPSLYLSSSYLRDAFRQSQDHDHHLRYLLSPATVDYIRQHELYA